MHVKGTDKQADHRINTPGIIQAVRSNSDLPVRAWGAASTGGALQERLTRDQIWPAEAANSVLERDHCFIVPTAHTIVSSASGTVVLWICKSTR